MVDSLPCLMYIPATEGTRGKVAHTLLYSNALILITLIIICLPVFGMYLCPFSTKEQAGRDYRQGSGEALSENTIY